MQRFEIQGNTVFDAALLQEQLADLTGRTLSMPEIQAAADRLTLFYRSRGYHAVALVPEQPLQGGVVRIVVVEARLGQIKVEAGSGAARVPLSLARSMLESGQRPGELLDLKALDRANLILADVPGVKVESALRPGAGPGQTDVVSVVSALPAWSGTFTLDTNDARTTGRARAALGLSGANVMGLGEQFNLAVQKTEGKEFALLSYSHALHASGTRGAITLSDLRYRLVNGSQVRGSAQSWSATVTHPWARSDVANMSSSLAWNYADSTTQDATGDSRSRVGTGSVGLNGNWLDGWAGGGFSAWSLQWSAGSEERTGVIVQDRSFNKWTFSAWRMQRIGRTGNVSASINGQWAEDALPGGETLSLGGATGVRAYPAFEGNGDRGAVVSVEYRLDAAAGHVVKAFYDHGLIHRLAAASGPARYGLKGVGAGWEASLGRNLQIKTALAWRIGRNPFPAPASGLDADGSLRRPQVWASAVYSF